MARTALEEMWGGTFELSTGADTTVPLPSGVPGAVRLIANKGNTLCRLPDARLLPLGGPIYTVWNDHTSGSPIVVRNAAADTLMSVGHDESAMFHLLDNTTERGVWIVRKSTAAHSAAQTITVDEFRIEIGPGINLTVNIRTMCDQLGYAGTNPVRVQVFVGPQGSATVGAVGGWPGLPAMDTGTFPAGSIIILTVLENGYISGRGGNGGGGQPITGGTPASPTLGSVTVAAAGGDGLHVRCDTVLYNYGRIQGGGGGGSGGGAVGAITGPGGGGGAGYYPCARGSQGTFPANQGFGGGGHGTRGRLNKAGLGGGINNGAPAGTGGAGGDPGQNGNDSSSTAGGFGVAGNSISVDTSEATLTKVVAGNIDGPESTL